MWLLCGPIYWLAINTVLSSAINTVLSSHLLSSILSSNKFRQPRTHITHHIWHVTSHITSGHISQRKLHITSHISHLITSHIWVYKSRCLYICLFVPRAFLRVYFTLMRSLYFGPPIFLHILKALTKGYRRFYQEDPPTANRGVIKGGFFWYAQARAKPGAALKTLSFLNGLI